jgi:hypothetical protein
MSARAVIAIALALLFPGAGHVYLRRRALGITFCAIIVVLFTLGLVIHGDLYSLPKSRGDVLKTMASLGSMGTGALYFITLQFAPYGSIKESTFEYGSTFTLTAGLMNLLLVLDAFDRATGRKDA